MIFKLINYISEYIPLTNEEIKAIAALIEIRKFKKGDVLLKEGMISKTSYFNLKGCVRLYYLVDGEEKTTFFYTENQFITSLRSFTNKAPSSHYLECTEDCILALLPYETEKLILNTFPKFETFSRMILEKELGNHQEMLSSYIISNPEQRYLDLLKNEQELLQRVPLFQLASYIGIQPESLSRLRSRLAKSTS